MNINAISNISAQTASPTTPTIVRSKDNERDNANETAKTAQALQKLEKSNPALAAKLIKAAKSHQQGTNGLTLGRPNGGLREVPDPSTNSGSKFSQGESGIIYKHFGGGMVDFAGKITSPGSSLINKTFLTSSTSNTTSATNVANLATNNPVVAPNVITTQLNLSA